MSSGHLLVVDDEQINLEIIAEYLEGEDYELTMAENGSQAIALLDGPQQFDVVILDRMMPDMDGLEVLRRIRNDARLRSIPVVMQTAAAGHEQVAEGLRLGAYYYLTKPYHRDSLIAVVNSALDVTQRRRDLGREIEQYRGLLALLEEGEFHLRTLRDAHALAAGLSSLAADPPSVALGMVELLINGIEHGNLGISFEEKAALLAEDRWDREVTARLALPANASKRVRVRAKRSGTLMTISVRDDGPGFDWRSFIVLDESRALHPNGRGIALAKNVAFQSLEYVEPGNEVVVTITLASA